MKGEHTLVPVTPVNRYLLQQMAAELRREGRHVYADLLDKLVRRYDEEQK
jgi:hypothetical protein